MEGERRTKPWASGRVLTQAQRERKRERNRLSCKRAADRTRDRIAMLEECLRGMQPSLTHISDFGQQPFSGQNTQWSALRPSGGSIPEPPPAATLYNADGLLLPPLADTQDNSISSCVVQQAAFSAPFQAVPAQSATYMIGGNYTCPTTYGAGPRAEPDDFFNTLLSSVFHRGFNHICTDEQIYEDLLSRVILGEGWDTLLNRTGSVTCPLLTVLRHLDEAALQECHPIDRLALLHAVHTKYLSLIVGSTGAREELPSWYRSRPTQILLKPSLIVDFVIWPGMRERLAIFGDLTSLSGLWSSYINHFRFYWPGQLEDAFETNHCGDRYKLSGEFHNRFRDLGHWRMDTGFFTAFPAFVDDILPSPTIPQHLNL